jgi:hypothetical protein
MNVGASASGCACTRLLIERAITALGYTHPLIEQAIT